MTKRAVKRAANRSAKTIDHPASPARRLVLSGLAGLGLTGLPALTGKGAAQAGAATSQASGPTWRPDHTVIVILENLSAYDATPRQTKERYAPVYAPTSDWRFLNELGEKGARFTNAHFGRTPYGSELPTRSSQPNYLFLFSGHHQGVLPAWFEDARSPYKGVALRDRNGKPLAERVETNVGVANGNLPDAWLPLTSPNLGAAILQSGGSFLSFSESLPYPSWNCGTDSGMAPCSSTVAASDDYRRKHNPTVNWTDQLAPTSPRGLRGDLASHVMPVSVNLAFAPTQDPTLKQRFRGFDKDAQGKSLPFDKLPDVSIVVPNEQHDAHSNSAKAADDWLRQNLGAYAEWAGKHNSLLIVTFDEDGSTDASKGDPYVTGTHRIPTIFFGAGVKKGAYAQRIDHLNVLATVLWLHGALDRFKADFKRFHKVADGSGSEAEKEWLNLLPITDVFEAGR
ncbi:MAG: alkaline phosphatase family protein [Aquabacterium sp.]